MSAAEWGTTRGLAKQHLPALQLTEQHLHQLSNHNLILWRQQRCQGCSSLHGLARPRGGCLLQALPDRAPHPSRGCAAWGVLPLCIASLQSRTGVCRPSCAGLILAGLVMPPRLSDFRAVLTVLPYI